MIPGGGWLVGFARRQQGGATDVASVNAGRHADAEPLLRNAMWRSLFGAGEDYLRQSVHPSVTSKILVVAENGNKSFENGNVS